MGIEQDGPGYFDTKFGRTPESYPGPIRPVNQKQKPLRPCQTNVVLTAEEFERDFPEVVRALDLPSSVQDVLHGARGRNRVQNRTWLRVPRPVTNGSKS